MATRPQPHLRACPLEAAPLPDLLSLIAEERRAWQRRLLWDPAELGDALELAASARALPGAAVLEGRRLVAYLSAHPSGDCFRACSLRIREEAPPEAATLLVAELLSQREADGRRLEAQLTAFEWQDALDRAFAAGGVRVAQREWLAAKLGPEEALASDPRLRPWSADQLEACAGLLAAAHEGSVEARINSAFRGAEAAAAYLGDVVRGPGCGHLLPWASCVAIVAGRLAGFCLVTAVSEGVAHVPQVAVLPEHQGRGLGDALLRRARAAARAEGCRRLTLSVSLENERARRWYLARGFERLAGLSAYWS